MNKQRRTKLTEAIGCLETAKEIVEESLYDEEDCYRNTPENLEGSKRYQEMEDAIDNLEDAKSSILDAISSISSSI